MIIIPLIVSSLGLLAFARTIRAALADPMVRGLIVALAAVLAAGTVAYWLMEDWSLLDSLYFCVITLLTIGYGDFAPETAHAKLFTIAYCFVGVGLFAIGATTIVQRSRLWERIAASADGNGDEAPD